MDSNGFSNILDNKQLKDSITLHISYLKELEKHKIVVYKSTHKKRV